MYFEYIVSSIWLNIWLSLSLFYLRFYVKRWRQEEAESLDCVYNFTVARKK